MKSLGLSQNELEINVDSNKIVRLAKSEQGGFQIHISSFNKEDISVHKLSEEITLNVGVSVPQEYFEILSVYLPIILGPLIKRGKPFVFVHAAQTLDGKIATPSGLSKGIGNEQNLIHCHRLRTLCDAVLIGATTLKNDNSRLNVRLVKGEDPSRVVLSRSKVDFSSLSNASKSTILWVNNGCHDAESLDDHIKSIVIKSSSEFIPSNEILNALYDLGIKSLFIEGGSTTIKSFLAEKNLDYLQIHIAPYIFGSGINTFVSDNGMNTINDKIDLKFPSFCKIGDGVMYSGYIK